MAPGAEIEYAILPGLSTINLESADGAYLPHIQSFSPWDLGPVFPMENHPYLISVLEVWMGFTRLPTPEFPIIGILHQDIAMVLMNNA